MKTILYTLFHVTAVEYEWISSVAYGEEEGLKFEGYETVEQVKALSDRCRPRVESYIQSWAPQLDSEEITQHWRDQSFTFTHGEIMSHLAAHEIHHMGQLSVWARELELTPVNANVIFRGLS